MNSSCKFNRHVATFVQQCQTSVAALANNLPQFRKHYCSILLNCWHRRILSTCRNYFGWQFLTRRHYPGLESLLLTFQMSTYLHITLDTVQQGCTFVFVFLCVNIYIYMALDMNTLHITYVILYFLLYCIDYLSFSIWFYETQYVTACFGHLPLPSHQLGTFFCRFGAHWKRELRGKRDLRVIQRWPQAAGRGEEWNQ